ncbi:hypothetical protein [Halomonas maura]|uniref:hypothetical protein n=1 Tax=Halomonas maura TaxID=117606 RepID=UPI0025B482E9|nr:hypothetical protein [Halomonas maura]MDN3554391.1 hypothetical protein [Halomonas maura]
MKYIIPLILFIITSHVEASPWQYQTGKVYCNFTHPAEMVSPVRRSTCEEQHVIQQQSGGLDQQNVVWWSASSHVSTDVWGRQTWENNRPWAVIGFTGDNETNLEKAYMLGTFGSTWSLFQHSYQGRGESSLIMADFDGISNLLYGTSWLANLPQKYINKVAHISERGYWHLMIDMLIALIVLGLEGIVAVFSTIIGLIVGTAFNPLDTLFAIPGGLWKRCINPAAAA